MKTLTGHGARIATACALAATALIAMSPTSARADRDDWQHNRGNHYGWTRPGNPHNQWNGDRVWFHRSDRDSDRDRSWSHRRDRNRDRDRNWRRDRDHDHDRDDRTWNHRRWNR